MILEEAVYTFKPDIDQTVPQGDDEKNLFAELESCFAALQYWKVQNEVEKK